MAEDMEVDTKELILILAKFNQHMAVVVMVRVHLLEDLHHQDHRVINKKNQHFKKFQLIKFPVHLTLVDNYGVRPQLQHKQNNKKQHHTKQRTNLVKIKVQQCLPSLTMVKKEWMKIAMMMLQ